MLTPEEAADLLLDPVRLEEFIAEQGLGWREGNRMVNRIAADAGPISDLLRRARRAGGRGRRDLEDLCDFVERAGRLPDRPKEVFYLCVIHGMTLEQCAQRLGITRATVRVHLRRLRRLMRECNVSPSAEITHGLPTTHGSRATHG